MQRMAQFFKQPIALSLGFHILVATLFSSGIGILFGVYPARKAAMLSPIEALRRN